MPEQNDNREPPWRPLPPLMEEVKDRAVDELHRRLRERGYAELRPGHGCVFRFVDAEGMRLTEIAGRARLSKQAVGEVVDDVERLGYVERVPDPLDGRAKLIRLTERGRRGQEVAREILAEIEQRWAERIGAEHVAALREALELIAADDSLAPEPAPEPEPVEPVEPVAGTPA